MNQVIAHRGLKVKGVKENSIEAFLGALGNTNYAGFECDVRTSKDGEFVVVHGPIWQGNIVSVSKVSDLKGITLLKDVLKLKSDKIFLLEIKEVMMDTEKLVREIKKSGKNVYLMSFYNKVIQKFPKSDFYKLGVLNYVLNSEDSYEEYDFICLLESVVTRELVDFFHQKKIDVFIYGIHHFEKSKRSYSDCYLITDEIML